MLKALQLATEVEPGKFEVVLDRMYPAVIDHIKECLNSGAKGDGVIRDQYYPQARNLPAEAWGLALTPFQEAVNLPDAQRQQRNKALELARLWFTELLHRSIGGDGTPLHLVLLPDRKWRLG